MCSFYFSVLFIFQFVILECLCIACVIVRLLKTTKNARKEKNSSQKGGKPNERDANSHTVPNVGDIAHMDPGKKLYRVQRPAATSSEQTTMAAAMQTK